MLPLSFEEYISYVGDADLSRKYIYYITKSSFPYTLSLNSTKDIRTYLEGIYTSILVKDISTKKI